MTAPLATPVTRMETMMIKQLSSYLFSTVPKPSGNDRKSVVPGILRTGLVVLFLVLPLAAKDSSIRVKYVSPEFVYISAGQAEGIRKTDRLTVLKKNKRIAVLEAVYTASHSSSCKILTQSAPVRAGDTVLLLTQKQPLQTPKDSVLVSRTRSVKKRKTAYETLPIRISGYAALQSFRFIDASGYDQNLPSLRFKLKVNNLFSPHLKFRLRFRSRYNRQGRSLPALSQQNRLYEASLSYDNPQAFFYAKLGRIISSAFSGIGYMDGLLLGQRFSEQWKWGVFAGTQPQWQYSDFQTAFQKYGAFVNFVQGRFGFNRLEAGLSAAAVYHNHTVSREFLFQRFFFSARNKWTFYQSLEIDINRNWRRKRVPQTISLSGLYLSGRYKFTPSFSAGLQYDNRKNYYTYEIRSLADSLFDAAQRQGLRSSAQIRFLEHYQVTLSFGIRKRATEKPLTVSYGTAVRRRDFLIKHLSLSGGINGFNSYFISGLNPSARIGFHFPRGHSVDVTYGAYLYRLKSTQTDNVNQWLRFKTQLMLPFHFYLGGYYQYNWGDTILGHRIFSDFGYYF